MWRKIWPALFALAIIACAITGLVIYAMLLFGLMLIIGPPSPSSMDIFLKYDNHNGDTWQ